MAPYFILLMGYSDTASASVLTAMRFKAKGGGETEPSPAKRRSSIGIGLKDDIPDSETFQDQGLLSLTLTNQNGLKVRHHSAGWLEPCIASGVRQQVRITVIENPNEVYVFFPVFCIVPLFLCNTSGGIFLGKDCDASLFNV